MADMIACTYMCKYLLGCIVHVCRGERRVWLSVTKIKFMPGWTVGWRRFVGLYLFLQRLNRVRSLQLPIGLGYFPLCSAQLSCGLRQVCSSGYTGVWSVDLFIVCLTKTCCCLQPRKPWWDEFSPERRFGCFWGLKKITYTGSFLPISHWRLFLEQYNESKAELCGNTKPIISQAFIPTGNFQSQIHLNCITPRRRKKKKKRKEKQKLHKKGSKKSKCFAAKQWSSCVTMWIKPINILLWTLIGEDKLFNCGRKSKRCTKDNSRLTDLTY